MSRFWSETTRGLSPYVPGEQPRVANLIKLNTNEHPLAPSQLALAALADVTADSLRRYPDPDASRLREAIAASEGLAAEQVFVGNGSDEVLGHVFQALLKQTQPLVVPDVTYSFYPVWAQLYDVHLAVTPLADDFSIDLAALCASTGPIIIANPNAPTGIALSLEAVATLVRSNPDRLVVVDEAYFGFGAATAAALIKQFDNLLVTRTLSKSHALAGLRVGYALGQAPLIAGLTRVKDSFNSYPLDAVAQAVALAAIEDQSWFEQASQIVVDNRAGLVAGLAQLGFHVLPSSANFVFTEHATLPGEALFTALRERNILVRRWSKPRINNFLRITVGSADECVQLLSVLAELVDA
jgi:histidinol-phosphate aminotransferase